MASWKIIWIKLLAMQWTDTISDIIAPDLYSFNAINVARQQQLLKAVIPSLIGEYDIQ